jgi:hypothetical protein
VLLGGRHWAREGDERSAGRRGQLRRPSYRYRYRYRYSTVATCRRPLRQDETLVGPGGRVFAGGQVGLLWCGRRRRGGLEGEDLSESGSRRCVCQRPRSCCTERRGARGARGVVEEVTIPPAQRYCTVCTVCTIHNTAERQSKSRDRGLGRQWPNVRSAASSNGLLCRLGAAAEPWRGGRGRGAGSRWI